MSNSPSMIKSPIKARNYIVLCFCLCLAISCSSYKLETKSNAQITNTPVIQNSIKKKAQKMKELYEDKNCKEFFKTFPNTFQEFSKLYEFDDKKGEYKPYSNPDYITYFFSCPEVPSRERLKKSIEIGINGKWEADFISMFQDSTFKLVKDQTKEAKEILDNLPDEKASSFWYFLFDGPHPNNEKEGVDLLVNLLGKDSNQSKLLLKQFKKLQADWENH